MSLDLEHEGVTCCVGGCSQIDFLSYRCNTCGAVFCETHFIAIKVGALAKCPGCARKVSYDDKKLTVNPAASNGSKEYHKRANRCQCCGKDPGPFVVQCPICEKPLCVPHRSTAHACHPPLAKRVRLWQSKVALAIDWWNGKVPRHYTILLLLCGFILYIRLASWLTGAGEGAGDGTLMGVRSEPRRPRSRMDWLEEQMQPTPQQRQYDY
jgi:hypothetical protein